MITKYLGDREFWRKALKLALPIAFQNLLMSLFTLVDTVMVSQLGDVPLAAVGMAGQWSWLVSLVLFGLCSGSSVFIAQYWGVRDTDRINRVYGLMLTHAVAASTVFMLVGAIFPEFVIGLFNKNPSVISHGADYLRIAAFSYVGVAVSNIFSTLLRSTENVRLPMYVSLFTTVENAVLNYMLIYGVPAFGLAPMGVRGAAIATVVSSWTSVALVFLISYLQKNILIASPKQMFSLNRDELSRFYRICLPVILNESLWGLGTVCYNIIFGQLGYEQYAAVTICRTVENVAFVFFVGLCNACCVLTGKAIGAGEPGRAFADARRFAVLVPLLAVFIGGAVLIFRPQLITIFNLTGTLTEATRSYAMGIMTVYAVQLPMRQIPYIQVVGIFRSGGDTLTGMKYDLGCVWLLALPLTLLSAFVLRLPFTAVYAVMLFGEDTVKSVLCLRRFISGKWIRPLTREGMSAMSNELN